MYNLLCMVCVCVFVFLSVCLRYFFLHGFKILHVNILLIVDFFFCIELDESYICRNLLVVLKPPLHRKEIFIYIICMCRNICLTPYPHAKRYLEYF